jgi:hypothetical protein
MNLENAWVFDIETFPNCFVLVAKSFAEKPVYHKILFHDSKTEEENNQNYNELISFLNIRPTLIGYNNLAFDGQVIEEIWKAKKYLTPKQIYDFVETQLIKKKDRFDLPYSEWNLSFAHVDLFKINHYDRDFTSLKWLEFTMRVDKMQDLPVKVGTNISKTTISKLVSYCTNDVDKTQLFFFKCQQMIELRKNLAEKYKENRIINMSDSSIGEFIMKQALLKSGFKKSDLQKTIKRETVAVKDCLLPYINFDDPNLKYVHEMYKNLVIENIQENGLKAVKNETVTFRDMEFTFGLGGVHACYKPGIYESDENYVIVSRDVKSYYPFLSIVNGFYPEHLGKVFCEIYKSLYKERSKYEKGSAMNYAIKIALNASYGKSNSVYSPLYDPKLTLQITINGQFLLTMLAEELSKIEGARLLMCNTDGLEIKLPRSKINELNEICDEWMIGTGLEIEGTTYEKMVIRDVNTYFAKTEKGEVKRKGAFRNYYDFTEEGNKPHSYSDNPSATIIPEALFNYYFNNISIEDYINQENSIYPFLYGIKGKEKFEYMLIKANTEGVVELEKRGERAIRFFVRKNGANLFKFWNDGRENSVSSVLKGKLIETAMNIKNNGEIFSIKMNKNKESSVVVNYEVDKEYYINECYSIIQDIKDGNKIIEETEE